MAARKQANRRRPATDGKTPSARKKMPAKKRAKKQTVKRKTAKKTAVRRAAPAKKLTRKKRSGSSAATRTQQASGNKKQAIESTKTGKRRTTSGASRSAPLTDAHDTQSPTVAVIRSGNDKLKLLDLVLSEADFWFTLEQACLRTGRAAADLRILIKPDLDAFELAGSTATDPQLIEHLIDLLAERGYRRLIVAEGRQSADRWLENRDVQLLADLLGYRYITPAGHEYDIVDLCEQSVDAGFGAGSILNGSKLSQDWLDADFRIVFAKNKTDIENAYALGLDSLVAILPLRDKDYHYRHRLNTRDVCLELLRQTRIDFCLIDAWLSNHGNAGTLAARPVETHTLIASRDLLLADYTAARKMGLDSEVSPVHNDAMRDFGLPQPHRIDGDLSPYPYWINVHPLMLASVRGWRQWPELSQILGPWIQSVDHSAFPLKDPVNEQINRIVSGFIAAVDDNPAVFWMLLGFSYLLGILHQILQAMQTLFWKDRIWQREVPLNIAQQDYRLQEYEEIAAYLAPLEERTQGLRRDSNGLRWMFHEDGSVLFEFERVIPVDYHEFVSRVDICKSIQHMNDYIGGLIVAVKKDRKGRTTHQLERNLYLPQPNYLALYQGKDIDVSKLEFVRYEDNRQTMYWKTVKSENGSANYDDGRVTFRRLPNDETEVCIFGRQQFTLPLFWQLVDLDNYPLLKHVLFEHAYTTFFTRTLANFEAVYEGREVRIGKAWNPAAGEPDDDARTTQPSDQIVALVNSAQDFIQRNMPDKQNILSRLMTAYTPSPDQVDDDGFQHFKADTGSQEHKPEQDGLQQLLARSGSAGKAFWTDLYEAIQRDWGMQRD